MDNQTDDIIIKRMLCHIIRKMDLRVDARK